MAKGFANLELVDLSGCEVFIKFHLITACPYV